MKAVGPAKVCGTSEWHNSVEKRFEAGKSFDTSDSLSASRSGLNFNWHTMHWSSHFFYLIGIFFNGITKYNNIGTGFVVKIGFFSFNNSAADNQGDFNNTGNFYRLSHSFSTHLLKKGIGIVYPKDIKGILVYKPANIIYI